MKICILSTVISSVENVQCLKIKNFSTLEVDFLKFPGLGDRGNLPMYNEYHPEFFYLLLIFLNMVCISTSEIHGDITSLLDHLFWPFQ